MCGPRPIAVFAPGPRVPARRPRLRHGGLRILDDGSTRWRAWRRADHPDSVFGSGFRRSPTPLEILFLNARVRLREHHEPTSLITPMRSNCSDILDLVFGDRGRPPAFARSSAARHRRSRRRGHGLRVEWRKRVGALRTRRRRPRSPVVPRGGRSRRRPRARERAPATSMLSRFDTLSASSPQCRSISLPSMTTGDRSHARHDQESDPLLGAGSPRCP